VSWYTSKQPSTAPVSNSIAPGASSPDNEDALRTGPRRPHSPGQTTTHPSHSQEEEVVASGWGEDGDGEDGMGML